jgi:hypothetical protein
VNGMIDNDPIGSAGRRRRRQKRFPMDNPACLHCHEPNLECLTPVTVDWLKTHHVLIEMHHIVFEENDPDFVVPLCLNCHRKITEALVQAIGHPRRPSDAKTRVALMLDGLAIFLYMEAEAIKRWAGLLRQPTTTEGSSE